MGVHKFGLHFLLTEWEQVVDAWQLESWEAYRDVGRLGRKTRPPRHNVPCFGPSSSAFEPD